MAMKNGFKPLVLMTMPTPEPTTVVGGATGQSTPDVFACGFDDWMNLFAEDKNNDNKTDFEDYRLWFIDTFGDEAPDLWEMFNDTPLYPEP